MNEQIWKYDKVECIRIDAIGTLYIMTKDGDTKQVLVEDDPNNFHIIEWTDEDIHLARLLFE